MQCNRLEVRDFRNIVHADVTFCDGVNVLIGDNAQGKTNLIEAIYYAALGRSFRPAHGIDLIRFGASGCSISADFTDLSRQKNITIRLLANGQRRLECNKVKMQRLSELMGQMKVVLFCPEHLSLVKEGPSLRRNYLDVALSQLRPLYLSSLQRYTHILKQRNKLLKTAEKDPVTFRDTIGFWSEALAKEAAFIARQRLWYVNRCGEHIKRFFAEMTGSDEVPSAIYQGSAHLETDDYADEKKTEEAYKKLLSASLCRETAAESTLWGIHKDDVSLLLNGHSARLFTSQGQQRSLALALKLAEGEIAREEGGEYPIFLFDDVLSELDSRRRAYLTHEMPGKQVILTTCEGNGLRGDETRIEVFAGSYNPINRNGKP